MNEDMKYVWSVGVEIVNEKKTIINDEFFLLDMSFSDVPDLDTTSSVTHLVKVNWIIIELENFKWIF